MGEKLQIDYMHDQTYATTAVNAVGATTSLTLRTDPAHALADTNFVRKFGKQYAIGAITNAVIEHPRSAAGNAWTFEFWGYNAAGAWVSMGTVADTGGASGAFAAGSSFAATKIKIIVTPDAGDTISITDGDHITLTTDIDVGGMSVMLSGESMTAAFTIYLADSGSTYYDANLKYGGKRHTPAVGIERLPYFTPQAAHAALAARTKVHVLDSEYYVIDEWSISTASLFFQAELGQTPTFCTPIGSSVYREVIHDGNNSDTAYVASTGSDVTGTGKWWTPYATHSAAFTAIGARTYINTQDTASFTENIALSAACTMEPIYGIVPTLQATTTSNEGITITHGSVSVSGYNSNRTNNGINVNGAIDFSGTISFITFTDCGSGVNIYPTTFSGTVKNCKVIGRGNGLGFSTITTLSGTIKNNICYNNTSVGLLCISVTTLSGTISNNVCYGNLDGLKLDTINSLSGIVKNNTLFKNTQYGLHCRNITGQTGTIRELVATINTTYDFFKNGGVATVTESTYGTNSGVTVDGTDYTTDPEICKTLQVYKLGISTLRAALTLSSHPYHTGTSSNNMGVITHGILLGANSITFDGIIFDGLDAYAHAIYCLATRTGTILKWCTLKNFIGISVDGYATAATSWSISTCWFKDNGQALALPYGSNTISYSIFSGNSKIGLWINYTGNTVNHCVFYTSSYGLYLDGNGSMVLKNSIFNNNGTYGIFSEAAIVPTYCNLTDAYNSNVAPDTTCKTDSPLFVDITSGSENFRVKTIEGGYLIESTCKGAADDAYDMGAYLIVYSTTQDSWKKYTVAHNPRNVNDVLLIKSAQQYEYASGDIDTWAKAGRRVFPLQWAADSATTEAQLKNISYISSLVPTRENALSKEKCKMRLHLAPTLYYGTGTGAVSKSGKTLTDTSASYYPDEKKGFWVAIIYNTKTSASFNATTKIITKAAAGWTVDAWIGYYVHYGAYYYYILDNDATTLTVSDPNNYMTTVTADVDIVKMYKIKSNTATVLTLADSDGALVDGTYSYRIDYVLCRLQKAGITHQQAIFAWTKWNTKSGYELVLEEID